ncbi:Sec-independent protein translocase protein TatB [Sphingomonas sp. PL-96]|uniref:Sec-independent protein translocase protein TatB n=1 Tax=Sphingomonas sp. PL-96 TaxID=2887201 RepID=UPI001E3536B0|nr:Sec-independent protein translocase protein TatB [Sphingomonas sp. PL-96]MCC2975320.1 Sec-independent protein translocase protein TatB [Sphingomonas sp. PL-96]
MLDFNPAELMVVAVVALLVIGPKDLPKAMRFVGQWVGKARGVARQFRSGFDAMVREAELAEMEKKWAEENARILREHPAAPAPDVTPEALPGPADVTSAASGLDVQPAEDAGDAPILVEQPHVVPLGEDDRPVQPPAVDGKAPS